VQANPGPVSISAGQFLPGVSERQRSRHVPNPVGEPETEAAQHGRLGGKADIAELGRNKGQADRGGETAPFSRRFFRLLEELMMAAA
jgi:hypothetical protein